MNILASYKWIKEYLDDADSVSEFARKMSASGMSVERAHDLGKRFEGMVVGVIAEVKAHPNADRLKVVETDVGGKVITIVCGGVNLAADQKVAVALPGSLVRWHGQEEWVKLETAKVRGVDSFGMIVAGEEIGFDKLASQDERGPLIWDITQATNSPAGTPLVQALDLDDTVFDIEVTTNRSDAMSIIGLAREAGAVRAGKFHALNPSSILHPPSSELELSVSVKETELCLRYQAVVMDNVKVAPSPWWMQKKLLLAGHKPINNLVDITNLILHEYGQPMHTFDYDKLEGKQITVRLAKDDEKFLALDGNEYELTSDNLVIADARKPVAIAGVMGGEETGTTEGTTRIVLECATFDPVSVRRTSRALNLQSDSQQLFEKGLSTEATPSALARAIELVAELAGGRVASDVFDAREEAYKPRTFIFDPKDVNARMGIEVSTHEQERIMESLGFELEKRGDSYIATVPYWRDHDIEDSVDFTEEVARIYGYENIPAVLPSSPIEPLPLDPMIVWQDRAKQILASAGCTELYHYSFASEADLVDWGYSTNQTLSFTNPLSADQKYLRVSLVPSVLRSIERNQGNNPSSLVFELANIYVPREGNLPLEEPHCVIAGSGEKYGLLYVKGVFERLMSEMGITGYVLDRSGITEHWHPGRSAVIKLGNEILGFIGELAPQKQSLFKLDSRVSLVVLNMAHVIPYARTSKSFTPVAEFPSVKRDLAFVVDRKMEYGEIKKKLEDSHTLLEAVEVFDVYEGNGIEVGKKSMALHLSFRAQDRTLSSEEVEEVLSTLKRKLETEFGAIIR